MTANGPALMGIVQEYFDLGSHRTGTAVDARTRTWMVAQLTARGVEVAEVPFEFDRWECASRLTVDGDEVEHLAVSTPWTGSLDTTDVHIGSFDPASGGVASVLAAPIEAARAAGARAAVLATEHPEGALVAVNRDAAAPGPPLPTVLAAGRDLERLRSGRVRLGFDAAISRAASANLEGSNGVPGRPLLLATPLNGWFGCAGERGTGIAVLLHLVERFAGRAVRVLATGGHELGNLGAKHWVASAPPPPGAIVHVGASVAVVDPSSGELIPTRLAMTSVPSAEATEMAAALTSIGLDLHPDTTHWLGEGETLCEIAAPLLSFTGAGPDFHTPDDTPGRATSPPALRAVADAIGDAAEALMRRTGAP